jgi:hypothetical protein
MDPMLVIDYCHVKAGTVVQAQDLLSGLVRGRFGRLVPCQPRREIDVFSKRRGV